MKRVGKNLLPSWVGKLHTCSFSYQMISNEELLGTVIVLSQTNILSAFDNIGGVEAEYNP